MGGLFQPKVQQVAVAPPEPKPPAPMPDSNSPQVREARRRSNAEIMGRAGRSSTILSAPENRAGGDSYSQAKLG